MATFFYSKFLGEAELDGEKFSVTLFTSRTSGMMIPGGCLILGMLEDDELKEFEPDSVPEHISPGLTVWGRALEHEAVYGEEYPISDEEKEITSTSIIFLEDQVHLITFTEKGAAEMLYEHGFRVPDEGMFGREWKQLKEYQLRQF